jgi:dihydrofolate reductase
MKVSLIVAVSENKVIGKNNDLAWHLPDDMKFFQDKTKGHFVIMGRRNYESIPHKYRPLPNRTNVIVSRQKDYLAKDCFVVDSIIAALELAQQHNDTEPFIIGGGQIYRLALEQNLVHKIYLTRVHTNLEGDTYFEHLDEQWKLTHEKYHPMDDRHPYSFTFQTYER